MNTLVLILAANAGVLAAIEIGRRRLGYSPALAVGLLIGLLALGFVQNATAVAFTGMTVAAAFDGTMAASLAALIFVVLMIATTEECARLGLVTLARPGRKLGLAMMVGLLFALFELLLAVGPRSIGFLVQFTDSLVEDGTSTSLAEASTYFTAVSLSLGEMFIRRAPSFFMHIAASLAMVLPASRWVGLTLAILVHATYNSAAIAFFS